MLMQKQSYELYLERRGKREAAAEMLSVLECSRSNYEQELTAYALYAYPCWELGENLVWDESAHDWPSRWQRCGGRLYEGRMIAAKHDLVWSRLSTTFPDGFGNPFPPYAPSSKPMLISIDCNECFRLGVLTPDEVTEQERLATDYAETQEISDEIAGAFSTEFLEALKKDLDAAVEKGRQRLLEQKAEEERTALERAEGSDREAEEKQRDAVEKNRAFYNVSEVRSRLPTLKANGCAELAAELMSLLTSSVESGYLSAYPNWLAQAYRYTGEIFELMQDAHRAVEYYGYALQFDPKIGIRKRMTALQEQLARPE